MDEDTASGTCNSKAPARMIPAVGMVFSVSCYIYFFKDLAGGFVPSPAGYILFMWEGYGKGRVGIDGCWQILDKVYDVLITCFSGNGVYGFSVADFSQ